ncbi:MAG TPA: YggS family pyridoxal phosphate-dependent enzyme [Opitutaceae bacterium]|nr:YggS family pyridoxal phosphate-dependent enzyme [Opitutaceae bacterium]
MFLTYEDFAARADAVRGQIAAACLAAGRDPREVELLAVTKTHPPEAADYAARYGLRAVGENRVQEAVEKKALTRAAVAWELIGHLQSNKARLAAEHFDRIQGVDNEKLLDALDRAAAGRGCVLPVLLEINAGADPAKFGAPPAGAPRLLEAALRKKNLWVDGLMTVAPLSDDPAVARRAFATLRQLRDRLAREFSVPLAVLSMGMSGDLAAAVAEGSTLVRIGTALFGARE